MSSAPSGEVLQGRRRYDARFRQQALDYWRTSGKTLAAATADLGLKPWTLRDWRKRLAPASAERPVAAALRDSKKNAGHLQRSAAERYAAIQAMSHEQRHSARSRGSPDPDYAWRAAQQNPGPRAAANRALAQALNKQFQRSRGTSGSPRLTQALRRCGHRCGRHRVARLMRPMNLVARPRRRFRPRTTDSRRIVGWAFSDSLASGVVLAALRMALQPRRPPRDLLHHSDRGVQYACGVHRATLQRHGLLASMSRAGNCYDNAAMESFWSSLKTELPLESRASRLRIQAAVFDCIECFYNRERLHSALGYKSPVDFENSNQ